MRRLFEAELTAGGLELAFFREYTSSKTSFTDVAKSVSSLEFDTMLIPDQASGLVLLAPALASEGIWSGTMESEPPRTGRTVQLLIPSTGIAPDLIRRAGRYLQGALFAVSYHEAADSRMAEFGERFRAEYHSSPTFLAAFGHDAVVLIGGAIYSGARTREAVRRWLAQATAQGNNHLPLVTRFEGFSAEGEPLALPRVLQLIEDRLEVVK
jgi:hypothetical protein